ncbi:hypothetical protein PRIPAC_95611 [Pristionchus pacificus]|uniref:Uncharacterized protein n=1 Tax=Pristionchus pacificus TaxID=54126 RepID=A0A2A6BBX9_PRIPA|nr:hypothetical protein PRIPAC_95611 [Pristionchus pacificus]|eukprot:PDM63378.1 hypothetical protein PRIPAC_53735 [Pristionchus pacificus]
METGVIDWVEEAIRRKLRWANKIRNMDGNRWARRLTVWIPYDWSNRRAQGTMEERDTTENGLMGAKNNH